MVEPRRHGPRVADHGGPSTLDDALARLRAAGGHVTQSRKAIVQLFHDADRHLTAEEVHELLPDFDEATVYRALAQLEEAGVIHHRHYGHGPALYRWATADTVPIVCQSCGTVVELDGADLRALARRAKERHGMTLDAGHFALTGWCDACVGEHQH